MEEYFAGRLTVFDVPLDLRLAKGFRRTVLAHLPQIAYGRTESYDSAESTALARELRRRGLAFIGPTTMNALMEAIGIVDTNLIDSHRRGSSGIWPIFK